VSAVIIARLGLAPHPEGGWYRETLRVPDPAGGRDFVTAIHFLPVSYTHLTLPTKA
jgi:predicted cupin superfamily sugar epimerase